MTSLLLEFFVFTQTDDDSASQKAGGSNYIYTCICMSYKPEGDVKTHKKGCNIVIFFKVTVQSVTVAVWRLQLSMCAKSNSLCPLFNFSVFMAH